MIKEVSGRLRFKKKLKTQDILKMYDMCRYEQAWNRNVTCIWCLVSDDRNWWVELVQITFTFFGFTVVYVTRIEGIGIRQRLEKLLRIWLWFDNESGNSMFVGPWYGVAFGIQCWSPCHCLFWSVAIAFAASHCDGRISRWKEIDGKKLFQNGAEKMEHQQNESVCRQFCSHSVQYKTSEILS